MRIYEHTAASSVFSATLYGITGSSPLAVTSFIAGIFIDLDHVLDYWKQHPRSFDIPHFFKTCEDCNIEVTYLWLHSIELLLPLFYIVYITRSAILLGFALGITQHLILDCIKILGVHNPGTYFLFYRWYHNFKGKRLFCDGNHNAH